MFESDVRIVLVEPHPPYNRMLVDKGILPGLLTVEQAAVGVRRNWVSTSRARARR